MKTTKPDSIQRNLQVAFHFYQLAFRLKKSYLFLALGAAFFQALTPFLNVIVPKFIIDELMGNQRISVLINLIALIVLGNGLFNLINRWFIYQMQVADRDLIQRVELNMGKHIMQMDFEKMEDPVILNQKDQAIFPIRNQGVLLNMTTSSLKLVQYLVSSLGMIAIITTLNPLLLLFILAMVACNSFIFKKQQSISFRLNQDMVPLNRKFSYYLDLTADFTLAKDVRLFNMSPFIMKKMNAFKTANIDLLSKVFTTLGLYDGYSQIILQVQMIAIYSYMFWRVFVKAIGIGDFTMYVSAAASFATNVSLMLTSWMEFRQCCKYLDFYLNFAQIPSRSAEHGSKPNLSAQQACLEFKHVWFKYPRAEEYTLKDVSIRIAAGEKLSVVGPNGAGKTTFIKLLCRLYEPEKGEILLNGTPIKEFDEEEYHKILAVVFQDYKLFSFSVRDNICLDQPCDENSLQAALSKAGIADKIATLPKGLDTPLYKNFESDGIELSGGEMQKLVIARAVYKDSPIVVLDEPTAALDPYAEFEVYSKFNDLVQNKTAIYISHRLSSCRFCDHIAVFDNGRLVEYGTHDELEHGNGLYAQMWQAQAQYYQAGGC
ncbi:MAG TPA: ABC transporter ATP-binding protein [Bacillota bacterium]|nr:ABC transporter ATP-binding protein [Bacillota bacterium]